MTAFRTSGHVMSGCLLGVAAWFADARVAGAQEQPSWTKRFRLGVVAAVNLEADFSLGGNFAVSEIDPGAPGVGGVNHVYDDGYVRLDDTGNAGGYTSNWGYENASQSQYDPVGETLTFHGTTGFNQTGSASTAGGEHYGLDLAYGGRLTEFARGVLGFEFGFTFLPTEFEDRDPLPVTARRIEHRFSTAGVVLPQAPYNGSASGIGPVIRDVAEEVSSTVTSGLLTGVRQLEANVFDFRLGPNQQWHLGGRCAASVGGGFALGLVSGEYSFEENIEFGSGGSASNRGSFSSTEVVFGGYAEAMVYFRAEERSEIYVGVQYVSVGDVTFGAQGREARLNLGNGLRFAAGIHWIF